MSRLFLLAVLIAGLAGLPVVAQAPAKKDAAASKAIRLPSGAIIVIAKDTDLLDRPDAIYLTPEKYKELNDQIDSLRKQQAAEKAVPPSSCALDGRLETRGTQTIVRLQATFRFRTTAPRSVVFLGCQKTHPVEAKQENGKLPLLMSGDRGLSVLVDSVGDHTLTLVLEVPLQTRGNEAGFEIGLPGSPITTLTFETPPKVKRFTLSRRETAIPPAIEPAIDVKRLDAERLLPSKGGEGLGAITYLALGWEDFGQATTTPIARAADTDIQVVINDADIITEARLRLKGSAKEWRFLAPFNSEVNVGRAPLSGIGGKPIEFAADQAPDVVRPDPGKSEWRIRFREVNSADVLVVIGALAPRNRGADPKIKTLYLVGPFAALDVPRQDGLIRVRTVPQLRATAILRGDTQRIDSTDEPGGEAIYRYLMLPTAAKDQFLAPMDLEIRATSGIVQTHVVHHLQWVEGGWRLRSDIKVTPIRTEVDALDVEVPVPGVFEASTPKIVEGIVPLRDNGPTRRVIQVKLAAPQRNEFTVTLEGLYSVAFGAHETTIVLPRVLNVVDRSGQVTVAVPDGYEVRGGVYAWEVDNAGTRLQPFEAEADRPALLRAEVSGSTARVELLWRPLRSDFRADLTADVVLGDRQAQVVQNLKYVFADRPQRRLRLRSSAPINSLTVNPGVIENTGPGDWTVILPADAKDTSLMLTYGFALTPDESGSIAVPLAWPEGATACDSKVRFLRDRDAVDRTVPRLDAGNWQELPVELLANETTLLVARSNGINVPLSISLRDGEAGALNMPTVWINRALIQAQAGDGIQKYRARFHLTKWQSRYLELDVPAAASDLELRINGLATDPREILTESETGRVLRVPLPAWRERQQLLVDVRYTVTGGMNEGLAGLVTRWQPPRPRGRVSLGVVRWQIAIPARSIPLSLGEAVFDERWAFRGALVQSVPAYTANDLDRWITLGVEPGPDTTGDWDWSAPALTARQAGLTPLRLIVVPRLAWFLVISLVVLSVGLLLSRLPRRAVGGCLALMGTALIAAAAIWPQPSGQVLMAAQPGLIILLAIVGLQRLVQWRYRRRLARMPGFSRIHAESAHSHPNSKRSVRKTSTVDSPAAG